MFRWHSPLGFLFSLYFIKTKLQVPFCSRPRLSFILRGRTSLEPLLRDRLCGRHGEGAKQCRHIQTEWNSSFQPICEHCPRATHVSDTPSGSRLLTTALSCQLSACAVAPARMSSSVLLSFASSPLPDPGTHHLMQWYLFTSLSS